MTKQYHRVDLEYNYIDGKRKKVDYEIKLLDNTKLIRFGERHLMSYINGGHFHPDFISDKWMYHLICKDERTIFTVWDETKDHKKWKIRLTLTPITEKNYVFFIKELIEWMKV